MSLYECRVELMALVAFLRQLIVEHRIWTGALLIQPKNAVQARRNIDKLLDQMEPVIERLRQEMMAEPKNDEGPVAGKGGVRNRRRKAGADDGVDKLMAASTPRKRKRAPKVA